MAQQPGPPWGVLAGLAVLGDTPGFCSLQPEKQLGVWGGKEHKHENPSQMYEKPEMSLASLSAITGGECEQMFIGHTLPFFSFLLDKGFIFLWFILLIGSCVAISPFRARREQRLAAGSSAGHANPRWCRGAGSPLCWRGPAWEPDTGLLPGRGDGVNAEAAT